MKRERERELPKVAVWNVVKFWNTLLLPAMMVRLFPSPTNMRLVFFLPTFKFSSYLCYKH